MTFLIIIIVFSYTSEVLVADVTACIHLSLMCLLLAMLVVFCNDVHV